VGFAKCFENFANIAASHGIEGGSGFVEEHDFRLSQQSNRESEPLLHALGVTADSIARALVEADERQYAVDLAPAQPVVDRNELCVNLQDFARGEPFRIAKQFGKVADPGARARIADRYAEQRAVARAWGNQPQQHLNGARLPRAIGTEKTENGSPLDFQRKVDDGEGSTVGFRQRTGFNRQAI
jgi:hypothetical protein